MEIIGHRGTRGTMPENTLAGFAHCFSAGVTAVEFDLHLTADGEPVILHDARPHPDLTRGLSGCWLERPTPPVFQMTFADLAVFEIGDARPGSPTAAAFPVQRSVDGEKIPSLDELLELAQAAAGAVRPRLVVEIKSDPADPVYRSAAFACTRAACAALRGHDLAARAVIQSFDWQVLALARDLAPDLARSYLTVTGGRHAAATFYDGSPWLTGRFDRDAAAMVAGQGGQIWAPHRGDLDAAAADAAKAAGLGLFVWTVNAPDEVLQMADHGVDGLITDYPERAQRFLASRHRG